MFPNGGENKEKFRFILCVGREVGRSPLDEVSTMDLSHNRLEWLDPEYLKALTNLSSINLADNFLKDAAVLEGELHHLKVKALDISNNMVGPLASSRVFAWALSCQLFCGVSLACLTQVGSMKTLANIANGNPNLEVFRVVGNRCMQRDVPDDRVKLLSRIPRCALQGFTLVLNGVKVSITERLDAVRRKAIPISVFTGLGDVRVVRGAGEEKEAAGSGLGSLRGSVKKLEFDEENLSRLRLALEMEAAKLKGSETVITLPSKKLDYIADLVRVVRRSLLSWRVIAGAVLVCVCVFDRRGVLATARV